MPKSAIVTDGWVHTYYVHEWILKNWKQDCPQIRISKMFRCYVFPLQPSHKRKILVCFTFYVHYKSTPCKSYDSSSEYIDTYGVLDFKMHDLPVRVFCCIRDDVTAIYEKIKIVRRYKDGLVCFLYDMQYVKEISTAGACVARW